MMTEKRKNYTVEFKHEAVRLVTEQGYSISQAARNLDINMNMLRRWKRQIEEQGQNGMALL
jgi:transposase